MLKFGRTLFFSLFLISGWLALCIQNISAQPAIPRLQQAISDQHKLADTLMKIANVYYQYPAKTLQYANEGLVAAKKTHEDSLIARAYHTLGNAYYFRIGGLDTGVSYFDSSLTIYKNLKNYEKMDAVYVDLGWILYNSKKYSENVNTDLTRLKMWTDLGNKNKETAVLLSIGFTYLSIFKFNESMEYIHKAKILAFELKDTALIAEALSHEGEIYFTQRNYTKSVNLLKESIQNYKVVRDTSQLVYDMLLLVDIYIEQKDIKNALLYTDTLKKVAHIEYESKQILMKMGSINLFQKNYPEALDYYLQALKYFEDRTSRNRVIILSELSRIYLYYKDYATSIKYATEALPYVEAENFTRVEVNLYKTLATAYSAVSDFPSAFKFAEKYYTLTDSLSVVHSAGKFADLQTQYETEKAQLEISEKDLELKKDQLQLRNQLLIFSVSFILLLSIAFVFYFRSQTRRIKMQNQVLQLEHKALNLQMNPHFIFNCLNSIGSYINQNNQAVAKQYLARFGRLMRLTLEHSRQQFIPLSEEIELLENYIQLENLRFEIKFNHQINVDETIDPENYFIPSMLIQPHVENAIIHGLASKSSPGNLTINFKIRGSDIIRCEVEDDGIGRQGSAEKKTSKPVNHKSLAVSIVKERYMLMNQNRKEKLHIFTEDVKNDAGTTSGTRVVFDLVFQIE